MSHHHINCATYVMEQAPLISERPIILGSERFGKDYLLVLDSTDSIWHADSEKRLVMLGRGLYSWGNN